MSVNGLGEFAAKRQALKFGKRLVNNRLTWAAKRRFFGTVTHVETSDHVVALTFDDGPHPDSAPRLLDILDRHRARATFFMVGRAAQRHPELVQRIAQAGHAIGNHTWDHPSLPSISGRLRRRQIRACERATAPYGQRLLRPPYGHQSIASRLDALLLGYQVIAWNLVAEDWLDRDPVWMADKLASEIKPGSVVCLHDAIYSDWPEDGAPHYDRQPMLEAVDLLLDRLGGSYRFVTIPELLRRGRPVRRYWMVEKSDDWKSLTYRW
ncbi:MAG TPA: polysaccharide deacetylase family protein [Pyrinomonadaceae bacterium]|nr:polysaccharide deacetylase family protein [Pyrinomonadaceae bacterium]